MILCKSSQLFEESQGLIGCMSLLSTKDPNIHELECFNIADNEAEEKDFIYTENSLHFDVHHCADSEQEIWHLTVSVAAYLHNYHLFLLTETNSYDVIEKNVMNSAIAWFKLVMNYI